MVYLRVSINGSQPIFSAQDNPASFSSSLLTRLLTTSYLATFNVGSLLCPSVLSYDWQMGSVALVTNIADARVLATTVTALATTALVSTWITSNNRCKQY